MTVSFSGTFKPDWYSIGIGFGLFVVYNAAMQSVAESADTVLVSFVTVWNVVGTSAAFDDSVSYSVEGYSAVGGVVSFLLAYVVASLVVVGARRRGWLPGT